MIRKSFQALSSVDLLSVKSLAEWGQSGMGQGGYMRANDSGNRAETPLKNRTGSPGRKNKK